MVIPWWLPTLMGALIVASMGFWGWLGVKVIEQGAKIADIEARLKIREFECAKRVEWMIRIEAKVDTVGLDVAKIRGALESAGVERRK